jgi:4'-phosphopantetheinyl transferase
MGEEIGMAGDPPAVVGIDADGSTVAEAGGATEPLRPSIWWPDLALPRAPQAPVAPPRPWLLLVDRRDPGVQAASADLKALLNPEERARRDRFRLAADRHRALLGRGVLRLALGSWLGRNPASLEFQLGPHGKPALAGQGQASLHFNLAHSGDLILLAFHATSPVGVDVEQHRPELAWEPLARRVLPPAECQHLEQLPPERRRGAFLVAWCRLEARLKARGEGFAGLERLHAEVLSGLDSAGERTWEVVLPAGYVAAVALAADA